MSRVAERWKVEAVLCLLRAVELERFSIAGAARVASKTWSYIERLGMTPRDVLSVIKGLEIEDYAAGPLEDIKGRPHDLWVFGKYLEAIETYIKFAVFLSDDEAHVKCISFHGAERPLVHPYSGVSQHE